MKITILCGNLEPGCDGVGDYSRLLAEQASGLGHDIQLISLCDDKELTERISERFVLRRANTNFQSESDLRKIRRMIDEWGTEAISLQFVPFSYHPKGVISAFIPFMRKVRTGVALQVMLHETWVRWERGAKLRHRLLGQWQRIRILEALRTWQAEIIHTSNPFYRAQLEKYGFGASILPLFGNIPIETRKDSVDVKALLKGPVRDDERRIIFPFNQDERWRPLRLLKRIQRISNSHSEPIRLIQIGRVHSECGHWQAIRKFAEQNGWLCDCLGPQGARQISRAFQLCHLGVSAGPIHLARKSGAVLSMLEHGLPVLCSQPSHLRNWGIYKETRLVADEEEDQTTEQLLFYNGRKAPRSESMAITEIWLNDLSRAISQRP